jgi:protein TonB
MLYLAHPSVAQKPCTMPYEVQVSSGVAAGLLAHKVEPVCQRIPMAPRVTGTAVIDIVIGKDGQVKFAKAISGPRLLTAPAVAAVRQYQYKPYILCGKPVEVETVVSIPMTCPKE